MDEREELLAPEVLGEDLPAPEAQEAAIPAAESVKPEGGAGAPQAEAAEEKVRSSEQNADADRYLREAESFLEAYPDVDVKSVPREVWREVLAGRATLREAYARHEAAALRRELAALKSRDAARERTTGARRSSTSAAGRDEFLTAFWE